VQFARLSHLRWFIDSSVKISRATSKFSPRRTRGFNQWAPIEGPAEHRVNGARHDEGECGQVDGLRDGADEEAGAINEVQSQTCIESVFWVFGG
jgi:hypothetical protein